MVQSDSNRAPWLGLIFAVVIAMSAACIARAAHAQSLTDPNVGPEVGAAIPAVALPDHAGVVRDLSALSGDNGVVLVFVRAADWCPFCQRQLIELSLSAEAFAAKGYSIVSISTDTPEQLAKFQTKRDIAFTLLADPTSSAVDAFGVRDPAYAEGHRAHGVPFPISFVINADGRVVEKFFNTPGYGERGGYRERISTADVLASLEASPARPAEG